MSFVRQPAETVGEIGPGGLGIGVEWGPVIAGAVAATALSFVLLAFGSGIGLAVSSTSPTWRDTSSLFWVVSGAYLIFIALLSFGLGGYVAGRMRVRYAGLPSVTELEFADGMHGLLTWALAIVFGALLAVFTAQAVSRVAVPGSGLAGPSTSVAGEATLAYELDELFRSDRVLRDNDMSFTRAEAARILLTSSRPGGVSEDDRSYLASMVTAHADVSPAEAQDRVAAIVPRAQQALKLARESSILIAFMSAAALIGAVVAWFGSREGGRERELGGAPAWRWSLRRSVSSESARI
jgi:hypothetical protein